ncbi:MAG: baseplate J/gp47 family protein [Clostridium sp.]|nr:baseplate J/gp47 family protein [Clostridium sp.]
MRKGKESGAEEILAQIAYLAKSYTPEWRFDREHPDAGTALAMLFADMFAGTEARFTRIPEKHKLAFFKQIGLETRPASAARGYVTFGLSGDEYGGTFLPKGVVVSGRAGGDASVQTEEIRYETTEALYVTPASLTKALFVDGERDYIAKKDVSAGFAPFAREEENLQEHVFYLCQNEVLSVSGGAEITLAFAAENGGGGGNVRGNGRKDAGEHDRKSAGENDPAHWLSDGEACSFFYSTEDGFAEYGTRRWDARGLTLAVEPGAEAPAKRALFGKEGYWLGCRYQKPWLGAPFRVNGVRIASRREKAEPDLIWNQEGEQENGRFLPFGENPAPFAECYFASAEALGKPDARVTLSFRLDYENIPFDHSVKTDKRWKMLMKRADFVPDAEYDITIRQVVWEYYNGAGWSRLAVEKKDETLFDGTGARAGQQVRILFPCPPDASLLEWQAAPTRYLRVRVLKMTNLYQPKGAYIVPVISGVQFAFDYGERGKTPDMLLSQNNGSQRVYGTAKKGAENAWELFCGQKETAPALYLGFHRPLKKGPIRILCAMQEELAGGLPYLAFSYMGAQGFTPLSVVDGTENFRKSGTLTFMGKEDFVEASVCGETAYWLRVQDVKGEYRALEKRGRMPRITGWFMNAAGISACAEQTGRQSGSAGNQEPGGIQKLIGSYGYVNRVTNPMLVYGGCGREGEAEALTRGSAALRHGGRAVTVWDFEALAREASSAVKKVKCYPNCNADGNYEPGAAAVALLLKEFQGGSMYFDAVRAQVAQYLSARMDVCLKRRGKLFVVEPVFLEMDCEVEAVAAEDGNPFEIQAEVERTAARFLHPLSGNYDGNGWEIGTMPNEAQMTNALKSVPGIQYIRSLRLTAYRNAGRERVCVELGGRDRRAFFKASGGYSERFMVPLPGKCHVVIC